MKLADLPQRDGKRDKHGAVNVQFQCRCGRWVYTIHQIDDDTFVCGNCANRITRKQIEAKYRAK